jgi:uncharacterized phosphosugar-binding protein
LNERASKRFIKNLQNRLQSIIDEDQGKIVKAAEVMAKAIEDDRMIHIWGPGGHSAIVAEDALYRKGGLACINGIYDPTLSISHGAIQEINHFEGLTGLAPKLLDFYGVKSGDVFIISSAWGVSAESVDLAIEVKKKGLFLIAITTAEARKNFNPNHPFVHKSKKVIPEIADISINNHCPNGDANVEIEGFRRVAPISVIMQSVVYQSLVAETVDILVKKGIEPPIWTNALEEDGIKKNRQFIKKYGIKVKCL